MKLSALQIIITCGAASASIRGSRNLSPMEIPHSVHKNRGTDGDIEVAPFKVGAGNTRIIGGSEARNGRFPYAVSIEDRIGHFCGGSLVAPDMILTAAHCQGGSYNVVIGRHDLTSNDGESIPMKKEFPHPNYNKDTTDNDYMLVKLQSSTRQSDIPFVKLNTDGSKPSVGSEVTVMGLGDTTADDYTQELAETLMSVTVNVISNKDCDDSSGTIAGWTESYKNQITDSMLCARDNGEDSCQGDSGGPLVIVGKDAGEDVQVGVVSWGIGCASKDFPGVYARVSMEVDWIRQVVCGESDDPPSSLCGGGDDDGGDDDDGGNGGDDDPFVDDGSSGDDGSTGDDAPVGDDGTGSGDDDYDDDYYYYYDDDDQVATDDGPTGDDAITNDDNNTPSEDDGLDDTPSQDDGLDDTPSQDDDGQGLDNDTLWPTWSPTPQSGDDDGNDDNVTIVQTGLSDSVPSGTWVTIAEDNFLDAFETGFFTSGGNDAKWLDEKKGRSGVANLQDGNGESSSIISKSIDLSFSSYQVVFDVYFLGMEDDKSFCFDVLDGSQWTETKCWKGSDLPGKVWQDDMTVGFTAGNNAVDLKVRFRCVGVGNQDDVLISKVAIQGMK